MTEAESNIRESLLNTLSFLASEEKQREFAAQVPYASYQGEFACWWFDTFFPEEPSALHIFSARQLAMLRSFSEVLERNYTAIGNSEQSIDELLRKSEWQAIVSAARMASSEFIGAT